MFNLKSLQTTTFEKKLCYDIEHQKGEGRDGTILSIPLQMTICNDKTLCEIEIKGCYGKNPEESLDKMAVWLRRLADGIEERNEVKIPI